MSCHSLALFLHPKAAALLQAQFYECDGILALYFIQ
jgi:hypothetical protein